MLSGRGILTILIIAFGKRGKSVCLANVAVDNFPQNGLKTLEIGALALILDEDHSMTLEIDDEARVRSSWNGAWRGNELIIDNDSSHPIMSFTDQISSENIFRIY